MMLVSGIILVLLVLTTNSTSPDDVQWKTTLQSTVDASTRSAELATSTPTVSPTSVTSTEALHTTAPDTSNRLPDAMEEEAPDYNDDRAYEAASADQSCAAIETATVPESSIEYDDVVSSGDGPHATSDNAEAESSTATRATADDASRGESEAQTCSRPPVGWREESRSSAVASGAEAAPEQTNWISWLPVWCKDWPLSGPLGVPRDVQFKAFAEALIQHTVDIENYWIQTVESSDSEEQSTEEPQTQLVSVVVHQVKLLEGFYQWIYQQLNSPEPSSEPNDCIPESLQRFLDALKRHTALVKSICHWSPSMRLICNAPDAGVLRDFFWAMDRQLIWVHVLHNWAANQYNLTAGPRRIENWWLPFSLNASVPFNASHLAKAGDDTLGLQEFSSSSVTTEERNVMIGNENSEDMPSEAADRSKYCSDKQFDEQEPEREGMFPSCVLQSISRGQESVQLTETERLPIDSEPKKLPEEGVAEIEATVAPSRSDMDSDDSVEVDPDEGIYEDAQVVMDVEDQISPTVEEEHEEEQEREQDRSPQRTAPQPINLGVCSETSVTQELGPAFEPSSLVYVRCDEREAACSPPEKCTPVSSVVSLTMAPWASFHLRGRARAAQRKRLPHAAGRHFLRLPAALRGTLKRNHPPGSEETEKIIANAF